jgi:heme exporter protein C
MTDERASRRLALTGAITAALTGLATFGVFFVAPEDADQGIIQKIFYFHVSIAIVGLLAFLVGAVYGIRYLRSREERLDEVSSIAIGIGLAFSVLVVITELRLRYSAIYSIAAFASVPLSFYSVRVARSFVHPVVFTTGGAQMSDGMLVWFLVSLAATLGVFLTVLQLELVQRRAERALRQVKLRLEAAT